MTPTAELEIELQVFEERRMEWSRAHVGKFVVIQDQVVLEEFFPTFEAAFKAGLKKFGVTRPFLVKEIRSSEPVYFVA